MRRAIMILPAFLVAVLMLYTSRFWTFALWSWPGLFGLKAPPPNGGLVAGWLRGTWAAPYELLIWAVGWFAILTLLQRAHDRLTRPSNTEGHPPASGSA